MDTMIVVTGFAFITRFNQISDRLRLLERHVRTSAHSTYNYRPFASHKPKYQAICRAQLRKTKL